LGRAKRLTVAKDDTTIVEGGGKKADLKGSGARGAVPTYSERSIAPGSASTWRAHESLVLSFSKA
jgi:hypothetical protein